jgi:hypothetical protein
MIDILELMKDHEEFHSNLQMNSFITVRNGGTLFGCYKQALRELASRIRAFRDRFFTLEIVRNEISEHERAGTSRDLILAKQKSLSLPEMLHVLHHTERELLHFYAQCVAIRGRLAAEGIHFPITADTRDRLDAEMWVHHIRCQAAIALIGGNPIPASTIEMIHALPTELRRKTITEVFGPGSADRLVEWFLSFEVDVPLAETIPNIDVRRVIGC